MGSEPVPGELLLKRQPGVGTGRRVIIHPEEDQGIEFRGGAQLFVDDI